MQIENEYLNAVPSPDPHAVFLDRHTPTGLFMGQNLEHCWVVETAQGRRVITLTDLYMPRFAVFTLSDRRLDYGFALGKPKLYLDHPLASVEPDDVGIIQIDDFRVAMHCCLPNGTTEWVNVGVYEPTGFTGLFFCGWRLFRSDHPTSLAAERNPYYFPAEPFMPQFTVECAEEIELVVNCRK